MEYNLRNVLKDYAESLADIEALLDDDPGNREATQVKEQLLASVRQAQDALKEFEGDSSIKAVNTTGTSIPTVEEDIAAAVTIGLPQSQPGSSAANLRPSHQRNPNTHPRNIYAAEEPNFSRLADLDARLQPFVAIDATGRGSIDFKNPTASRELTRALLKHDFGIDWWVEEGQLIPAVTNRANYIHWLQDLLQLSKPSGPIRGLDIGCGANLIYCLLGAAIPGWRFVGIDITEEARSGAQRNLNANPHLAELIEVRIQRPQEAAASTGILPPALKDDETFAFSMCNPPFFVSMEEAGQNPATAFEGTAAEMVCPGGELAFVMQMVADSEKLKGRVHWYTSMVGKKSTLKALRQQLRAAGASALRVTEFAQGRTSRWGIAWSFAEAARTTEATPLPRQGLQPRPQLAKRQTVFALQGRNLQAHRILQALSGFLSAQGCQCATDLATFTVTADLQLGAISGDGKCNVPQPKKQKTKDQEPHGAATTRIMAAVLVERPGVFAVRAKIPQQSSEQAARRFTDIMQIAEADMKQMLGLA